jgi:hypothetical protein
MLTLEVDGNFLSGLHRLYNWGSTVTLVLSETACVAGLQPIRQPRPLVRGFKEEETAVDSCFYLLLLDADGNIQVICTSEGDDIATVTSSRPPRDAGDVSHGSRKRPPHGD